jgi:hypothetical protein
MDYAIFKPKCGWVIVFCLILLRGSIFGQINTSNISPYDIVISEFMAKPFVNGKLPNSEFIELYNRTKDSIQLKNLRFYNDKKLTILPSYSLKSNKYVTIYKKSKDSHKIYGDTLALDSLFTLSNPDDVFYLATPSGKVIDAASYDLTLYRDSKKASGGVTLERINVHSPCNTMGWIGSDDANGGTPGKPYSQKMKDQMPLQIDRYYIKGSDSIVLVFNKSLNRKLAMQTIHFDISNSITILKSDTLPPLFEQIQLKLSRNLKKDTTYRLLVKQTLKDCVDSTSLLKTDSLSLKLPEKSKIDSILVNEILVNPETGGSRFIELYNNSKKVVDIADLKVGNKVSDINIDKNMLLFPNEYVVLADNPIYIQDHYKAGAFRKRIIKNKLPTWNEATDTVVLKGGSMMTILDAFTYQKSWHNPLIANTEGVSLERVNPNKPSKDASNWQSAAQTVGFATPSQQNSQYDTTETVTSKQVFVLEKKKFSPDGDGFEDYLSLKYNFDDNGYVATIRIFNDKGKLVKTLKNNELLEIKGEIIWHGDMDEILKSRAGIYILAIEWVSPKGKVQREKLACVLTGRL